ncbi:MAG: hypothetical protein IPN15_07000 [Saprospiraceae bacterium]|nr:hypothetical protein [Candidatus Vicinibacter affinis]
MSRSKPGINQDAFHFYAEFCKKKMQPNWLNKNEYPFAEKYFSVNGQQMHYVDGRVGVPILFVHGTPSWSFDFRNQIKFLSKNYRCIAPDHIDLDFQPNQQTTLMKQSIMQARLMHLYNI